MEYMSNSDSDNIWLEMAGFVRHFNNCWPKATVFVSWQCNRSVDKNEIIRAENIAYSYKAAGLAYNIIGVNKMQLEDKPIYWLISCKSRGEMPKTAAYYDITKDKFVEMPIEQIMKDFSEKKSKK